ncbi:hypothetical protein [Ramlibacter sp. WS9]|uniref:hypothetical protein n=1 Tax=Ramlibacter sp. WS9 TaxID=1882741 RepID=UPI00114200D9|nr:hypothetical protein [Ramlibacter sp. WS9]ROZ76599.1 hypothetical protein EEB15_12165 [Ramlibacter sp. WS9]
MLLTLATAFLLVPAYFAARWASRALTPKLALATVVGLAVLSALLMPGLHRIPPWQFEPATDQDLFLYLVSSGTFFTMAALAIFLAQRLHSGRPS